MAQDERPSTPEKQLLDLIEDPKEQELSQKKIKRSSSSFFSFSASKARISFLIDSVRSGTFFRNTLLDIKKLNKALRICIVLLFLYVISNFTMSMMRLKEVPEFVTKGPRASGELPSTDMASKRVSDYLDGPRARNIFTFGDSPREEEKEKDDEEEYDEVAPPIEETLSPAEELSQNLELVGIGWSKDPDVMIKDLSVDKMYFLKRGDMIDGLIKIEAIFKEKVILTYEGKEMELR